MSETQDVKGRYLGHSSSGDGFIYQYECQECRKKFVTNAPEASAPVLCHSCFYGIDRYGNKVHPYSKKANETLPDGPVDLR